MIFGKILFGQIRISISKIGRTEVTERPEICWEIRKERQRDRKIEKQKYREREKETLKERETERQRDLKYVDMFGQILLSIRKMEKND